MTNLVIRTFYLPGNSMAVNDLGLEKAVLIFKHLG